jgi:hypothetical protein
VSFRKKENKIETEKRKGWANCLLDVAARLTGMLHQKRLEQDNQPKVGFSVLFHNTLTIPEDLLPFQFGHQIQRMYAKRPDYTQTTAIPGEKRNPLNAVMLHDTM